MPDGHTLVPDARPPRHLDRALPPYRYVPGEGPHPMRSPDGHMYGREEAPPPALEDADWAGNMEWLWGVDLYNQGYFWEAHEAWEGLWHVAGRTGVTAELLQGLIQTAAAHLKILQENPRGVEILSRRSAELLGGVADAAPVHCGLDLRAFLELHRAWFRSASTPGAAPFPFLELR